MRRVGRSRRYRHPATANVGSVFLTDFLSGGGTFTRASESSYSDGSAAALDWVTANTRAINDRGDGNAGTILFRQTANLCTESEVIQAVTGWATGLASLNDTSHTTPDGTADGDEVVYTASVNANTNNNSMSGATTALAPICISAWAKSPSTGSTRIRIENNVGTITNSADIALTTTWARLTLSATNGASGTSERMRYINATDATARTVYAWGAQFEDNTIYPGPYMRTAGSTFTRPADTWLYTPGNVSSQLLSSPSRAIVTTWWTHTQIAVGAHRYVWSIDSVDDGVRFARDGTGLRVEVVESGVVRAASQYITISAHSAITIDVYPASGLVGVTGALTGDGLGAAGTAWTWATPATGLRVGGIYGGASELDGTLVGAT